MIASHSYLQNRYTSQLQSDNLIHTDSIDIYSLITKARLDLSPDKSQSKDQRGIKLHNRLILMSVGQVQCASVDPSSYNV